MPCEARNPCAPPCLVDVESALGRKMRRRCRRTFVVACEKDDPDPPNDCRRKAVELEAQESAILARCHTPLPPPPASPLSTPLACQSSKRRHPRTRLPRHHCQPPVHSTHRPASPRHARRPSADRWRAVCEADFACLLSTPVEAPAPAHREPARRAQMCLRHGQAGSRGSGSPPTKRIRVQGVTRPPTCLGRRDPRRRRWRAGEMRPPLHSPLHPRAPARC